MDREGRIRYNLQVCVNICCEILMDLEEENQIEWGEYIYNELKTITKMDSYLKMSEELVWIKKYANEKFRGLYNPFNELLDKMMALLLLNESEYINYLLR